MAYSKQDETACRFRPNGLDTCDTIGYWCAISPFSLASQIQCTDNTPMHQPATRSIASTIVALHCTVALAEDFSYELTNPPEPANWLLVLVTRWKTAC